MFGAFDEMVQDMMDSFGTVGYVQVVTKEEYDPEISENVVTRASYKVKIAVFDYLDKKAGTTTEAGTLIQTGDKQVFIQPPHKTEAGIPLPHLAPNRDLLKIGDKLYKIVAVKEYNPSVNRSGCVLYEVYVRE